MRSERQDMVSTIFSGRTYVTIIWRRKERLYRPDLHGKRKKVGSKGPCIIVSSGAEALRDLMFLTLQSTFIRIFFRSREKQRFYTHFRMG